MQCELQRRQAECMQFFVRAARRKFSKILQLFRAILAQDLRDLGASLGIFFAFERTADSVKSFDAVLRVA